MLKIYIHVYIFYLNIIIIIINAIFEKTEKFLTLNFKHVNYFEWKKSKLRYFIFDQNYSEFEIKR